MKIYKNGDRCPCCGTVIEGKDDKWLEEFSQIVFDLGLPPFPEERMKDNPETLESEWQRNFMARMTALL